jgi:hypothetical protein
MLLKVTIPVEKGNAGIADGSLPRRLQAILGDLRPEAAYFLAYEGKRTALIVLDLADPSQIPSIAEPFFMAFDAEVNFYPVMNAEDLARGVPASLEKVKQYG